MEKDIAWENFLKTGSVQSFLEYKQIVRNMGNTKNIENIDNCTNIVDEENIE